MITRIFRNAKDFDNLKQDWDELFSRAENNTPFQTHLYNKVWWSTLGGGEWDRGDLRIFAGYDPSDRLVGLAPLFVPGDGSGDLRLIGSVEISDYLDLILDPDQAEVFVEALLVEIDKTKAEGAARLALDNLLEGSPSIALIQNAARARGWQVKQEQIEPAPLLALPSSFGAYLEGLESKQRREFKRKMRRAMDYPARVTWRIQDQPEYIAEDCEYFLDLMSNDAEKRKFLTEPMKDHFRQLTLEACQAGWLHLAFLEASGKPIFGYLNFIHDNRIWVYNSGFDPDHFSLSPGWVLMGYLIEWGIEHGYQVVDFMRGDEDYKYRLGGSDRFIHRLTVEF
jgi:CelD/BcsL family acetyltransferase involved in cellulose biosynthesis